MRVARLVMRGLALAGAAAGIAYAVTAAFAWCRYGNARRGGGTLERFFPQCEIAERHEIRVHAPAATVFAAARDLDLMHSGWIRSIFRTRGLLLGADEERAHAPLGLFEQARAWGWGVLMEDPGREIVFGAVTQPWVPNPVFRALAPQDFAAFRVPGFVRIAWTVRVEPVDAGSCIVSTETCVVTTDVTAQARFRRYWSVFMPGIVTIRRLALRLIRSEAEKAARNGQGVASLLRRSNTTAESASAQRR